MGKPYKFIHHDDVWIQTNLTLVSFENDWLIIESNGRITVKGSNGNGYAWDGCSPKINFLDLCIGTPDGITDMSNEKPITYFASMIHDAIYQFKKNHNISRKNTDKIFALLLRGKFFWWRIYYFGVRIGGVLYGKWKSNKSNKYIKIIDCSWNY